MYKVEGSLEEFETYEEAVTELYETIESCDIVEFIDTSFPQVIDKFFSCGHTDDFYVWFSEKIESAFEQMKNDLITEYEEDD